MLGKAFGLAGRTQTLRVSLFDGKKDNHPTEKEVDLDWFKRIFTTFNVRTEKDGPLWSPACYGATKIRSDENVDSICALALDFDQGHDWDQFLEAWEPYAYAIHTTFQHTPEKPKWRAIFPLKTPVNAADWPGIYGAMSERLGFGITDPSCKDCSRMYYLPSSPSDTTYCVWHDGELLNADDYPPVPEEEPEVKTAMPSGTGRPGEDFEEKATWHELLIARGWKKLHTKGPYTYWERPGKNRKEVSARTGTGTAGDRFYCWSDSVTVPVRTLLTKFSFLAYSDFGGDFKAAASHLAREGYGAPAVTVAQITSEPPAKKTIEFDGSDLGNARRLTFLFGQDVRYVANWGKFVFWDGRRWEQDEEGGARAVQMVEQMIENIVSEASDPKNVDRRGSMLEWAGKCHNRSRIENAVALLKSMKGIPITPEKLDDPKQTEWLFNVQNGTVELKTGTLREHRREDYLTRFVDVPYDPQADCPTWINFLTEIQDGSEERLRFLWKALGYSLSGNQNEQVFFFCYGNQGNNGKSTMIETIHDLLGDYAQTTHADTFMSKLNKDVGGVEIAALKEARFVVSPETEDGKRLDESLMKRFTGGDTIRARNLYEKPFNFKFQGHIWITGNHKPNIRGTDDAIWRRVRLIDFPVVVPSEKRDPDLKLKLRAEYPGILTWLIEGCVVCQEERLGNPDSIKKAVESYRVENDNLGEFLDECTIEVSGEFVKCSEMYESYKSWADIRGEKPMTMTAFGKKMTERGEGSVPHPTNRALGKAYAGRALRQDEGTQGVWWNDK